MITSLYLNDFKNFRKETLCLGPLTVIIGANAAGKSNIRDAFRFLHGIGRGYVLADIIGGKYWAGGRQVVWEPVRGAPQELSRLQQATESGEPYYGFMLGLELQDGDTRAVYEIGLENDEKTIEGFRVVQEELEIDGIKVYESHPTDSDDPIYDRVDRADLYLRMGNGDEHGKRRGRLARVRSNQPGLTQIAEQRVKRTQKDGAEKVAAALGNMRFLDLTPSSMRQSAFPGQKFLGDSGENLPTVLRNICADQTRKDNLIDWVRELTPMDVVDFEFPVGDVKGQIDLLICEGGGRKLSANSISDGTLRFLAMLAALLEEDAGGFYFFEEIDNGIHPARLQLLLELIETQTGKGRIQVVTTTHSPDLLAMMSDTTFAHTSIVGRLPDTANAIIRPVADLPKAKLLRKSQGLDRLQVSGWMEDALAFEERREEAA